MQAKGNRRILDQVKDDSSSLFCVRDSASFCTSLTSATERSNLLDISFGFDEELTATKVYHRQWRPLIREALRRGKKAKEGSANCQKVHSNGLTPIISFPIQKNPRVVDVRILAVGQSDTQACKLSKIMSIMCEEHYDPELRRGHILQVILDTTNATLDKMAELSLPMENLGAEIRPQVTLRLQTPINSAGISEELGNALIALWDNPGVRSCYLDNIKRTAHPSAT